MGIVKIHQIINSFAEIALFPFGIALFNILAFYLVIFQATSAMLSVVEKVPIYLQRMLENARLDRMLSATYRY